ncbi:MAG: hypothetical protein US01_C0001G0023 [candidate division TM6 bacterium GW2011_GWF2_28_16]|nr:MAG: hypothetical protein US01_C0001G0023 [candidate division TM6 bacterium GW2011_GWF2_28_16]HAZ72994.1 hypothetical protein [Candidatus Paceibacterota bacterium]
MLRKKASHLLLVLFLVFSCFLMSAKPAKASTISDWLSSVFHIKEATTSYSNALLEEGVAQEKNVSSTWANSFNYINGNVYGGETMAKISGITGADKIALEESLGDGMLGDVNKGIVALYTPPASTRTYVADVMKSAKIIPEAQAQGLGFAALDPILETWKSFRNLAYLFFVLIFLIIGFMIMFRTKVGQAAITAQQAIPSVIIAMLAVTFSYAIAGFMIDIMYVVMYMLAGFFTEGSDIVTRNIFGLVGLMFKGTTGSTQNAIEQFMEDALNIGLVGEAIAWMSSLLGTVIVGIAILFATFKVFFELVKTYVAVLIQIIFSPIILMLGAFPGKNVFGKWLKDLAGNLILWPVVLLCILVQRMLTAPIRNLQGTGETLDANFGGGFMPPFLVGQGQASIIPVILGIGILLVIPEIMQEVKKAMHVDSGIFGQLAGSMGKGLQGAWQGGDVGLPVKMPFGVKDAVSAGARLSRSGIEHLGQKLIVNNGGTIVPPNPASVDIVSEQGASTTTNKNRQNVDVNNVVNRVNTASRPINPVTQATGPRPKPTPIKNIDELSDII